MHFLCFCKVRWHWYLKFFILEDKDLLTQWGRVMYICVSKLGHLWFRQWLVAWLAPSHYLNQCWNIVNWTLGNKLHWKFFKLYTFSFKKMHLKMPSGKWLPFCLSLNELILPRQYTCIWLTMASVFMVFTSFQESILLSAPEGWRQFCPKYIYRQTSNISCTFAGNKIVDHSDVVGASPVSSAPTTSSFST